MRPQIQKNNSFVFFIGGQAIFDVRGTPVFRSGRITFELTPSQISAIIDVTSAIPMFLNNTVKFPGILSSVVLFHSDSRLG